MERRLGCGWTSSGRVDFFIIGVLVWPSLWGEFDLMGALESSQGVVDVRAPWIWLIPSRMYRSSTHKYTSSGHPSAHKVCHLGSRPSSWSTRHSSTFVMCSIKITKAEGGVRGGPRGPGGPGVCRLGVLGAGLQNLTRILLSGSYVWRVAPFRKFWGSVRGQDAHF